jgi:hypothetical protein
MGDVEALRKLQARIERMHTEVETEKVKDFLRMVDEEVDDMVEQCRETEEEDDNDEEDEEIVISYE